MDDSDSDDDRYTLPPPTYAPRKPRGAPALLVNTDCASGVETETPDGADPFEPGNNGRRVPRNVSYMTGAQMRTTGNAPLLLVAENQQQQQQTASVRLSESPNQPIPVAVQVTPMADISNIKDSVIKNTARNQYCRTSFYHYENYSFWNLLSVLTLALVIECVCIAITCLVVIVGTFDFPLDTFLLVITIVVLPTFVLIIPIAIYHVQNYDQASYEHTVNICMPVIVFLVAFIVEIGCMAWFVRNHNSGHIHRHHPDVYLPELVLLAIAVYGCIAVVCTGVRAMVSHWHPERAGSGVEITYGTDDAAMRSREHIITANGPIARSMDQYEQSVGKAPVTAL